MNAITYSLSGRLGNQLQLFACARVLSLRHGWRFIYRPIAHDYAFNVSRVFTLSLADRFDAFLMEQMLALPPKVKPDQSRRHRLMWQVVNSFRRVVYLSDGTWDVTRGMMGELEIDYRQMRDTLFVLRFDGIFRNLGEERETILREILPALVTLPQERIGANDVGVHIRRDDTQYGMPMRYYVSAVQAARQELEKPLTLHLFSDGDSEPLAQELRDGIPDVQVAIHRGTAVEDMMALARYPTLILSQSWFSYWSALFSKAKVFAPPDFCYYPEWKPVTF